MGGVLALSSMPWRAVEGAVRFGLRWLSVHTGLPALLVAAVLIVAGYKILKKSARFALEVSFVAALLVAATSAGWIRW